MTDESQKPESPSDPRPNDEPYYIDSECQECGTDLVLHDSLSDEQFRSSDALVSPEFQDEARRQSDTIWHDEWVCPECLDGVYMDWPEPESD